MILLPLSSGRQTDPLIDPLSFVIAKIQAKGNSIVEATLKIVKNGSYSFSLGGGTTLYITVDVLPCPNCQQTPHRIPRDLNLTDNFTTTSSDSKEKFGTTDKPFLSHHDSICASTFESVCLTLKNSAAWYYQEYTGIK